MKKFTFLLAAAALVSGALPSVSHALVYQLAYCTTSDGQYKVSVQDNQGTGPNRKSHVVAVISYAEDGGAVIATYPAELFKGAHSISFGRRHYMDSATEGKLFLLEAPSTNFRHYSLHATIAEGNIDDDNLTCRTFN